MEQPIVAIQVFAKINLFLRILSKREDGYHEIDSLMHPVDISDQIQVYPSHNGFSIQCADPDFPSDNDNTIYKAYSVLKEKYAGKVNSCKVILQKNIPTKAGMGGASADAAGALLAFNKFFELSVPDNELTRLGASIGSDVAFFLNGSPAICTGRGEKARPVNGHLKNDVALAVSSEGVSTREAYASYFPNPSEEGLSSEPVASAIVDGDARRVSELLHNTFERMIYPLRPDLEHNRRIFLDCGASGALMTGSGATVFALGLGEEEKECARSKLESKGTKMVFTALRHNTFEWMGERGADSRSGPR